MSFKTLNIGVTALMTQKLGLDITGQNIANASTEGYARQRLQAEAITPTLMSYGAIGNGVEVKQIAHITDDFLEKQVREANSSLENLEALENAYTNLQVYFNELTENDLSSVMDRFWNAVADLNNNVEDVSTRRVVIEEGKNVADAFQNIDAKMQDYRERQNEAIVDTVGNANSLIREIAELNRDIVKMESGGKSGVVASDLRDQRTLRLKELSGIMDIDVNEEENGAVVVSQKTRLLVFENEYYELSTRPISSDDMLVDQVVFADDGEEVELGDGLLYAQVKIRDELILGYKQDMDQLAASFAWEFNRIHSQGIGLEGFTNLTADNSVLDTDVSLDQLQFDFTANSDTYEIVNGNFELIIHDVNSGEESTVNIEIDLDGESSDPDTILWDPANPTAEHALVNKLQAAFDSVQAGAFTVDVDLGNHLTITANTTGLEFGFGRDTSGAVAALGMNTFFSGYDASSIEVNASIDGNPELVAAATSFTPGDQGNSLALLELRETGVLNGDSATLDDFYEGVIGQLGIEASRIESLLETQEDIYTRVQNQREDLSGVNLDEELTKMILFQRSFQSAARFISTADSVLETLINM